MGLGGVGHDLVERFLGSVNRGLSVLIDTGDLDLSPFRCCRGDPRHIGLSKLLYSLASLPAHYDFPHRIQHG